MPSSTTNFVLASMAACSAASPIIHFLNSPTPNLPYYPSTTKYCLWWWDNDSSATCKEVVEAAFI
ncbi:hypothetical protein BJX63DRAFT_187028 [Aspergillus granulosus]|uniref:Uncharacterized protein n=1 Tax=Aspergillus granulosus TaxID=176169 RepID=A0ABR4HJS6_9EURO